MTEGPAMTEVEKPRKSNLERKTAEQVLAAFAARHGLPHMASDGLSLVAMTAGEDLEVALVQLGDAPYVLALASMQVDAETSPRLARELLQLNLSWADTGGAVFALLPPNNDIHFCQRVMVKCGEEATFERDLLAFLDLALEWQLEIGLQADLPLILSDALRAAVPRDDAAGVLLDLADKEQGAAHG